MKYSFKAWFYGYFFHSACKPIYRKRGISKKSIIEIAVEHKKITIRAKDMNDDRLLSSYIMGIYFIAMNRNTGLSAEENYKILETGLASSKMFRKGLGSAEAYLDEKNMPGRIKWAEESRLRKNENNWVLDVLPKCDEYDLGYEYYECGICKICQDEGCPELARYMCRLDYLIADIMNAKLVRTKTLAEGGDSCDFRYSIKKNGDS
ncbi:MAG: L-2-amino-thiazoline-4-carboxylic acid hydrolase [Lachnospiraceae bacterium]|nr:L-2-amino-thiazoline-4-carboxylic acid hydrolase [Lachnospiraceae bacterium]